MKIIRYCDECQRDEEVVVKEKEATFTFRNEPFPIIQKYAECLCCGNEVTDEALDTGTLQQLKHAYEAKHGISSEDLKNIRTNFNLSQASFSKLIGIGLATIKRYETGGSSPDTSQVSIYKMLRNDPKSIRKFYEQSREMFDPSELKTIEEKLKLFLSEDEEMNETAQTILERMYSTYSNEIGNNLGKRIFDAQKLFHMTLFFSDQGVLKTKLMKLLWYSDFLHFKREDISISGTPYWHLPYGPAPKQHELLLGCLRGINLIDIQEEETDEGYTKMMVFAKEKFNTRLFAPSEVEVLNKVHDFFKDFGSKQISAYAHREEGWVNTKNEQIISYEYAKHLSIN